MKTLLARLSSLLKEHPTADTWSSTRFTLLFTVVISNITIFGIWAVVCIVRKDLVAIPANLITIYSLANGLSLTGKVVQKRHELKHGRRQPRTRSTDKVQDAG